MAASTDSVASTSQKLNAMTKDMMQQIEIFKL
jgi:hypothetical protein